MLHRVYHYAQPHTRVRARIGTMPDLTQWQHIATARDVDTMIQRMREHGLARWVASLPRSPDASTIERSLQQGIGSLVEDVCRWLPRRWGSVKRWLRSGPTLALLPVLLRDPDYKPPAGAADALQQAAALPLEARDAALRAAGYARYLEQDPVLSLAAWLYDFDAACPRLRGSEARAIERIKRLLRDHAVKVRESRALARRAAAKTSQWRLRAQLGDCLRALLGYESFHAGLLLSYGLLELLQLERCRALLLACVHEWDATGVV